MSTCDEITRDWQLWNLVRISIFCRENVRKLIQQYFIQLTQGCGSEACSNTDCATGSGRPMNPTNAATRAVALSTGHSKGQSTLCSNPSAKFNGSPSADVTSNSKCGSSESVKCAFLQKLAHISSVKAKRKKTVTVSVSDKLPSSNQITR